MLPDQFVAHEAVDATVVGALVRVLDQTESSRALFHPCGMVRSSGVEQLDDAGAEGLHRWVERRGELRRGCCGVSEEELKVEVYS